MVTVGWTATLTLSETIDSIEVTSGDNEVCTGNICTFDNIAASGAQIVGSQVTLNLVKFGYSGNTEPTITSICLVEDPATTTTSTTTTTISTVGISILQ